MASSRNILFVLSNSNIGGPQKSLLALLDVIDHEKFNVSLYILRPGGRLERHLSDKVRILPSNELIMAATLPSDRALESLVILLKHGRFRMFLSSVFAILRHLIRGSNMNQERQRIWQRHASELPSIGGSYDLAFGILGMSSYCVVDCVESARRFHWVRSDSRILKRNESIDGAYYRKMDGALAVSNDCATIFEGMYPFMRGRVRVFHNHIPVGLYRTLTSDLSLMEGRSGYTKVLTVCRLDPLKGIEMAIDACKILVDAGQEVDWFILGGGPFRTDVESMIRRAGMQDSFKLLGFQLNTLAYIEACDVFVHPSRTEGKANAVDEAKYAGKPIVVTNYATVADQITHGVNGIVCEMNAQAIADSVKRLMSDQELAGSLASACKGREDGLQDVTAFFEELCEGQV